MKKVYQTNDGQVFDSEIAALMHEKGGEENRLHVESLLRRLLAEYSRLKSVELPHIEGCYQDIGKSLLETLAEIRRTGKGRKHGLAHPFDCSAIIVAGGLAKDYQQVYALKCRAWNMARQMRYDIDRCNAALRSGVMPPDLVDYDKRFITTEEHLKACSGYAIVHSLRLTRQVQ